MIYSHAERKPGQGERDETGGGDVELGPKSAEVEAVGRERSPSQRDGREGHNHHGDIDEHREGRAQRLGLPAFKSRPQALDSQRQVGDNHEGDQEDLKDCEQVRKGGLLGTGNLRAECLTVGTCPEP